MIDAVTEIRRLLTKAKKDEETMTQDRMDVLTMRKDEKSGKTWWTKVGVAFPTKDGSGWNVRLDALPVNGQLVMRPPTPYEERNKNQPDDDNIPFDNGHAER